MAFPIFPDKKSVSRLSEGNSGWGWGKKDPFQRSGAIGPEKRKGGQLLQKRLIRGKAGQKCHTDAFEKRNISKKGEGVGGGRVLPQFHSHAPRIGGD